MPRYARDLNVHRIGNGRAVLVTQPSFSSIGARMRRCSPGASIARVRSPWSSSQIEVLDLNTFECVRRSFASRLTIVLKSRTGGRTHPQIAASSTGRRVDSRQANRSRSASSHELTPGRRSSRRDFDFRSAVPLAAGSRLAHNNGLGDARMRDWLLVLMPVGFVIFWIIYPEKVSAAMFWLMNLFR
jgi:hypothetical protein